MKNLISSVFILVILGSCSKEVQNTIPDPPEGTYEVIFYNERNKVVFTRKGANAFYGILNNGTQIRLDDWEGTQTTITNRRDVADIFFQLNYNLNSAGIVNTSSFYGLLSQLTYIPDWVYETQTAQLKITEVTAGKIKGEFTLTVMSVNSPNPSWGNRITIKGKFYARCGGYGC